MFSRLYRYKITILISRTVSNKLGIIILRLDSNEVTEPGGYWIVLDPDADSDDDGVPDRVECNRSDPCPDSDQDGMPNHLDLDSDDDGLPDWVEADCDGEGNCANHIPTNWVNVPNSDDPVDGLPDFLEADSDGDGLPDWAEAGCWSGGDCRNIVAGWSPLMGCNGAVNCNTRADWLNRLHDSDSDGTPDYRETDSDDDTIEDWEEAGCLASGDCSQIRLSPLSSPRFIDWDNVLISDLEEIYWPDADLDHIPDYRERDSDDDHILDEVEAYCGGASLCDTDGDGEPDYRDVDSDGDTILDAYERLCTEDPANPGAPIGQGSIGPANLDITNINDACDSDLDAIPDFRDGNSDDDVIPDRVEAGDNNLNTDPVEGNPNNIPAFRDPDDLFIGPPPPTGGVDACLPFTGWPGDGLLPWGFNRGIACGLQLIRDTLANAGINVTDDPPVPGMLFYNRPFITADAAATTQIAVTAVHTTTSPLDASLTTGHTTIVGDFSAVWTTDAWVGTQFSVLSALDTAVYDETNTLIARGQAQVLPENGESAVALAMGDVLTYTVSGNGSAAFYAPALSTLGVGGAWNDYTAVIHANSPYGIGLQGADVIVNGQIYSGNLVLVVTGTTTLQGQGQTLVPNFTNQVVISATNAAVQMGPAAVLTGTLPGSVVNGFALPDYTGQLAVSQHTAELDQVTFSGIAARDLSLTLDPSTSSVTPVESASFQAVIASNADDVYDVGVFAPAGWNVRINNSGAITAAPPLGAQPGDYALQVTAQSAAGESLAATAVHTVTVTAYEGMDLSVAPDPLTTVPWGQSAYAFDSNDGINNGRPQIPRVIIHSPKRLTGTITKCGACPHVGGGMTGKSANIV